MFKIIDNKKVEITNEEYKMYEAICHSHDPHGKDLFKNLFEVNDEGIIIYLFPPVTKFSMQVLVFLQNLMIHQHLRLIYKEHDSAIKELKQMIDDVKKEKSN